MSNFDLFPLISVSNTLFRVLLRAIGSNNISNLTISDTQAQFLAGLKHLAMDPEALDQNCSAAQQREIHGMTFCVTTSVDFSSAIEAPSPATHSSEEDEESGISITILLLGVLCGFTIFALVIGVCVFRMREVKKGNDMVERIAESSGANVVPADGISVWQDEELLAVKVNTEDIKDVRRIGSGAYGNVWLVKYRETTLLVSKRLRKGAANRMQVPHLMVEIKIVAKLEHPNVVKFKGAAWTIEANLQALFEYLEGGDLRTYLKNESTPHEWTPEKIQIAIDIAEALVYAHSLSPPLVHRDLKSRNVLFSANFEAKLTDFGVSRFKSESDTMTAGVGAARWVVPEMISGSNSYGPATDIFSFGAVLSELDSHTLPYEDALYVDGTRLTDAALLQMISMGQLQPSFSNESCPDEIVSLAKRCLAFDPRDRPSAAEVVDELRMSRESIFVDL